MKKTEKQLFSFILLFLLFIFYGAFDNVAWNWGKVGWTWMDSIAHVLSNPIDVMVACVFALVVTYVLGLIIEKE